MVEMVERVERVEMVEMVEMVERVGIDNYGLFPLGLSPLETMQWAHDHGAAGVAFSGLDEAVRARFDCREVINLKAFAEANGMYLEWGGGQHVPRNLVTYEPSDIFRVNRIAAEEAKALGARVIRSCSGGLMRWNPAAPSTARLLEEMTAALASQKQMLMDHQVILAIETHFEFTTFELLKVFHDLGARPGEWIGICLDTMNLLTLLEDPLLAAERVLPWIVSTHIKDGGILQTDKGFTTFPAPLFQGIVNFDGLLEKLPAVNLNIEAHAGHFDIPVFDPVFRLQFPDLTDTEMEQLVALSIQTQTKMEGGSLRILKREEWPQVCEERMAHDLKAMAIRVKDLRFKN